MSSLVPTTTAPTPDSASSTSTSTSDSSSATSTSSGSSSGPPSSSLYLFTFLATLFLLLFVSSAIVMRSFFLRRRFRRRIEDAIATGVLLGAPDVMGPRAGRKLRKPKLWDAQVYPAPGEAWDCVVPVSARVSERKQALAQGPRAADSGTQVSATPSPSAWHLGRLALHDLVDAVRPARRQQARADPYAEFMQQHGATDSQGTDASSETPPPDKLASATQIEVALLIAMPNPHRHMPSQGHAHTSSQSTSLKGKEKNLDGYWDELEEGVPDVVIGVAHVPFAGIDEG